ncbi:MAG: TldD/PmbA family protein [Planctomycetota bacterium]|jgi:predicted Zn-dependent protease
MRLLGILVSAIAIGLLSGADDPAAPRRAGDAVPLIELMSEELDYSMQHLATVDQVRPYYLAYTITDISSDSIRGQLGALYGDDHARRRVLDVDVRVGDYALDSTRQLRGQGAGGFGRRFFGGATSISVEDESEAIKHTLWRATDRSFKDAVERYQQVLANQKTVVEEEMQADDFSREDPSVYYEDDVRIELDHDGWAQIMRDVSALALSYPLIHSSQVSLVATAENRYMVTSEGTRLKTGRPLLRLSVSASARADDGMDVAQTFIFNAASVDRLPDEKAIREAFQGVIDQVLALREAPLVEPYTGPAILLNRASGVFFHEIFGHRIEGHRQKDVEEGQTFTKMVGQPILPDFLSVTDDPTRARLGDEDLRGFYRFDDEGMPATRVELVTNGVLQTFLMSRSPVAGFSQSNGHGRRQPGRAAVSRQGNLIISSDRAVSYKRLREMLVEECQAQGKPYGFLFNDITGGFTSTSRGGPQAFKVLPVVVYRVYADGRPDELVRGVDIVGTPLSCFAQIIHTADDPAVFNGTCGAESGWVPVSAVSPSMLVRQIEIEKRQSSQESLPILAPPIAAPHGSARAGDHHREP